MVWSAATSIGATSSTPRTAEIKKKEALDRTVQGLLCIFGQDQN